MPWFEILIIAFILGGIGVVLWKGGAANPVGTGQLQGRVTSIDQQVKALKADLGRATERMGALETSCATSAELETLRDELRGDRRRTEQVFLKIEGVEADIAEIRSHQARRDVVIEALSESVRGLANDLKHHQATIAEKLEHLDAMGERIDANRRAIESIVDQLPQLRDRQAAIAEQVAGIAADVKSTGRQVERLYDVLVPKGLQK